MNGVTMQSATLFHEFDLSFLKNAAALVDSKLRVLELEARSSPDPDALGTYDKAEYITGFGLVACQTYIAACVSRAGIDRSQALDLGPMHHCGLSMVTLVNALANYWKHSQDWIHPLSKTAQKTVDTITTLYPDTEASYLTTNALAALLQPSEPRIGRVIPFLKQWRDSLQNDESSNSR